MTDKEQLVSEGEAQVVVKAADMAEVMQKEAINVAIEVRAPRRDLLQVRWSPCFLHDLPSELHHSWRRAYCWSFKRAVTADR